MHKRQGPGRIPARSLPFFPGLLLGGCLYTTLTWRQVGNYGPEPSSERIFAACVELLREKGWRLKTVDRRRLRITTEMRSFGALSGGKRAQLRIQLQPRPPMTYVFVMGVKNENLAGDQGPFAEAWGPDENDRALEVQYQFLIDHRLRSLAPE